MTNITKRAGVDNFTNDTATPGEPWAGIGPNGEAAGTANLYYSRIPAMTITEDNKMVVMFDLRWNRAYDQDRIDPGVAVSSDGGHTWVKKPLGLSVRPITLPVVQWIQLFYITQSITVFM